jgi:lipopolysaccharide/colanic/teichoic acid biosynthesis glycosyltransferase
MNKPFGPPSEALTARTYVSPSASVPARSLERRRLRFYAGMMMADMALVTLCFSLAGLLYEGAWLNTRASVQGQLLLPIFYTIALYNRTYSSRVLTDVRLAVRTTWMALIVSALLLTFVAFYTKSNADFSRGSFTLGLGFSMIAMAVARWLATKIVTLLWGGVVRNQMVLNDNGPQFELRNATLVCVQAEGLKADPDDPHMLDRLGQLMRNQDRVVVTCPAQRRQLWAFILKSAGIRGEIVSEPVHKLGALGVIRYDEIDRTTLLVSTGPLSLQSRVIKRAFDVAIAGTALILLAPVFLWVAARIKLEGGGPVFFVQPRLGHGNRFFLMFKFRSMAHTQCDLNGGRSTNREDNRVTAIGAKLRANSLDELPQLWNVLRGDMSIVGPRPHAVGSRANNKLFWEVDDQYWQRHSLKPGMTGLAQVRGYRGATEHEEDLTRRLQSDLEYIEGWTLTRDVQIVWRTLLVLRHDKAF